MTSRDPELLEPQLRFLWEWARDEWAKRHPSEAQPILTTTFRGREAQEEAVRNGTSNLRFGQSLHNFEPAYAFDIAFIKDGRTDYTMSLYERFAELLTPFGVEWGGTWERLVDGPHFQLPMTAADARGGRVPQLALPVEEWALVITRDGAEHTVLWLNPGEDVVMRVAPDRKRVYADIRRG